MGKAISNLDIFGVDPVSKLHYDNKEKHKSFIGGFCTICVIILFISIFLISGYPILKK